MNILVLQETDWLTRGPHIQHHIFERLSKNLFFNLVAIDYDIDNIQHVNSLFVKKKIYYANRTIKNSKVKIIRTGCIKVPFVRRITSLITNFFTMLKIIRKNRPDVIVGYSISNGLIGLMLAKLLNVPYIFHYIDFLHKLVPISYLQEIAKVFARITLKYADQVIVFTNYQREFVINEGVNPQKIKMLPNGVSIENCVVDEKRYNNLKNKFSINDSDFVIFYMGWLYDFAGIKEIIDYYNNDVINRTYNLKFLILGDGGIYNYLKDYIKEIGAEWVILAGRVPFFNVTEYIQLADLCLLSFEINEITRGVIPQKLTEYLAMKKPVLSNNLPGVILEIGKNNGVIFAKNQKDLIVKIGDLSIQKKNLKSIGQTGYELVKNKYVWPIIIRDFKEIMLELIKYKNNNNN